MTKKTKILLIVAVIIAICLVGLYFGNNLLKSDQGNEPQAETRKTYSFEDGVEIFGQMALGNPDFAELNCESADALIEFKNIEKGVSVTLPYNEDWGNKQYKLAPYDEYDDHIDFGCLIFDPEAGNTVRKSSLYFEPVKSAKEVFASTIIEEDPSIIKINDLEVVKYTGSGLYAYPSLAVIGEKYNYDFSLRWGEGTVEEFEFLEKIVETLKLIK